MPPDWEGAAWGVFAHPKEASTVGQRREHRINFLRPVLNGRLRAVSRVVKEGRTIGLVECVVTDGGQRLVARASRTCMFLRGERARGR
jgi:uncharacterized protein (TIGR00369 family)